MMRSLGKRETMCRTASTSGAYLEPVGALLPKAKTLKAETDAGFAATFSIWSFITFLKEEDDEHGDANGGERERV